MTAARTDTSTPPAPADAGQPAVTLSSWSKVSLSLLGLVSLGLAVMSFTGMFSAVSAAVRPWFGRFDWMVPVGTDLGIFSFAGFDVWLEAHRMGLWWLRWFIMALIGLQLGLNIGAAHGDALGSAAHAVLPVVFIGIIEVWRYLIRKRRKLIHRNERERIPLARYLADWTGSWDLRRRMVLWGINRYTDALRMRQQVLRAEAGLREIYGTAWKKDAPYDLVMMLSTREYLDEACADIAKRLADHRKQADRADRADAERRRAGDAPAAARAGAANGGPAPADSDRQPSGIRACCRIHILTDTNSQLPAMDRDQRLAEAKKLWRQFVAAHDELPGAETLLKVLTIGGPASRELRDQLKTWWAQSGDQSGAGSGPESGASGEGPVGRPVGAAAVPVGSN